MPQGLASGISSKQSCRPMYAKTENGRVVLPDVPSRKAVSQTTACLNILVQTQFRRAAEVSEDNAAQSC
jgi:hypothetical protein